MMSETIPEHPILFQTDMVRAVLAGIKLRTRRTNKLDYMSSLNDKINIHECAMGEDMTYEPQCPSGLHVFFGNNETDDWWVPIKCPYGNIGDTLWVRESFYQVGAWTQSHPEDDEYKIWQGRPIYYYHADGLPVVHGENGWNIPIGESNEGKFIPYEYSDFWRKRPSIHMPRKVSRLSLRSTGIRVERLQDITEEEAILEGIQPLLMSRMQFAETGQLYRDYSKPIKLFNDGLKPIESFKSLWESINGKGSWDKNPWVWVISFEKINN